MDSKQILEALQMQPLSEEEKSARHILGRLYGPIATCNSSTRNGRRYNKELWQKALNDDIFKEKIQNKSLFLELGHPLDREETDMEKVCACIPEMPKIVDGDLYAYVDILDTKNGQLLKKLCDYGFVPGISSRGSGDIMDNDEVDPDTFFLETWDIVQLPAVKDARLQMCESVDPKMIKLKKALSESYEQADDEGKKEMLESLNRLDIKLTEGDLLPGGTPKNIDEIPEIPSDLLEAKDDDIEDDTEEVESEYKEKEVIDEPAEVEDKKVITIKDLADELGDYKDDLEIEFKPLEIEGKEYEIENLMFDDTEDGKVVVTVGYNPEAIEGDNIDEIDVEETPEENDEAEAADAKADDKAEDNSEEADDAGDDEVIESLKEAIRQKDMLEKELNSLKSEKTVGDAKVEKLEEELNKYKLAFTRTSIVAADASKLSKEVKSLNEQLSQKDAEIASIKKSQSVKLTEGVEATNQKVATLTEKLKDARKELENKETKLNEQANVYKQKLTERTEIAKKYKNKYNEVLTEYINFRASMLGVRPADITAKLEEGFTMADINNVCENMLTENVKMTRLPISMTRSSKVKIQEQKTSGNKPNPAGGYEIDDSLLELAGLK